CSGACRDISNAVKAGFSQSKRIKCHIEMLDHILPDEPDQVPLIHSDTQLFGSVLVNHISKFPREFGGHITQRKFYIHCVVTALFLFDNIGLEPLTIFFLVSDHCRLRGSIVTQLRLRKCIEIELIALVRKRIPLFFHKTHHLLKTNISQEEFHARLHPAIAFPVTIEYAKNGFREWNNLILFEEFINRNCEIWIRTKSASNQYFETSLAIDDTWDVSQIVNE